MKKFLIIDDHKVVRLGLSALLTEMYNPCSIYEAGNKKEIDEKIYLHDYDVIFLDIIIRDVHTIDVIQSALQTRPGIRIIIFTIHSGTLYAKRYYDMGVMGYLQKDASVEELQNAIKRVSANKKYYSEAFKESVMTNSLLNTPVFKKLSDGEFEIYNLLLAGKRTTEISDLLGISTSTTSTHKANIFKKLNIKNIVELIEVYKYS